MVVTYSIESVRFRGRFLRLDGSAANRASLKGEGVVNCQASVGEYEKFYFHRYSDNIVAIESARFPNVYLRLDGRGVSSVFHPSGAGHVTALITAGPFERFRIRSVASSDGELHYGIESVEFPNVWLRMDAGGITAFKPEGGGIVNAQFGKPLGAGTVEAFLLKTTGGIDSLATT